MLELSLSKFRSLYEYLLSDLTMSGGGDTKMTRAMAQKLVKEGQALPDWIVSPAAPTEVTDPEVAFLAGDLQAEEEGEQDSEWNPDMDTAEMSADSEIDEDESTEDSEGGARNTRATNPMTDTDIVDVEAKFDTVPENGQVISKQIFFRVPYLFCVNFLSS